MENEETANKQGNAPADVSPITSKKQAYKERGKANETSEETKKQQKHSLWRNWKSLSRTRQLELSFLGLVAMGGVGYLIAYICVSSIQTRQAKSISQLEHRPTVIHSRPPTVQSFSCDPVRGMHTGNMEVFVKNVGSGIADNVFASWVEEKVVPEQKIGNAFWDDPPSVTPESCSINAPAEPKVTFSLGPGQEMASNMREGVGPVPPVKKGAAVQFYIASCVFYFDEDRHHGTCDTYRLFVPSSDPLDQLLGTPTIVCDGSEIAGKFMSAYAGHCQN
jgi:hypothetical protein